MQEHESLVLNVVVQVHVDAAHQILQLLHHALDARLVCRVVVLLLTAAPRAHLDAVQQARDAVVGVRLHLVQHRLVQRVPVQLAHLV